MAEDIVSRLVLHGQQYFSTITQAHQRTVKFQKDTQQGFKSVTGAIQTASKALIAFGAAAIARQIFQAINNTAKWGDELSKLNQRTGLTVEFLNGFVQAGKVADVEIESLARGIKTLNKNLLDAKQGTGEAKDELKRFGIGAAQAGVLLKTPEESVLKIIDVLSRIPDVSERGAVAQKLLGKAASEWLPLINQGTEALKQQIANYQKLRPITTEQAKAAEAYNDALEELTFAFEGLLHRGIGPLLPLLTDVVRAFTQLVALDIDGFNDRLAAMTGQFNLFRGVASLMNAVNTLVKDLASSVAMTLELIANPTNYKEILKTFEAIDKEIRDEANRRQSQLFPEATGGKPKDFTEKKAAPPTPLTMPTTTVTAQTKSAVLEGMIKEREALIELIKVEEERNKLTKTEEERTELETDRINLLREEIALLQKSATIQKEIETANKEGKQRAIDPTVAVTAELQMQAELNAIQNERIKKQKELDALREVELGTDIQSTAAQQQQIKLQETKNRLLQEQHNLEVRQIAPALVLQADEKKRQMLLGGQEIVVLKTQLELYQKENEVLGTTAERLDKMAIVQAKMNSLVTVGAQERQKDLELIEKGLGEEAVAEFSANLERHMETFRRSVRDAQAEVARGEALPGQLKETNRIRRMELNEAQQRLNTEEQRFGFVGAEEGANKFLMLDAQMRTETYKSQRGFIEGWQDAFKQFSDDAEGAFGLGQTLARNFVSNLQSGLASTISNIFDHAADSTLNWRTALETIPDILKQITSQLISMVIVQGIAQAIGGGLGGAFGGAAAGSGATAGPRTAGGQFYPQMGFASGGSFMVGGPGGTDRTPIGFMASRGERVTVETPGQQRGGQPIINVSVHNETGARVSVQRGTNPNDLKVLVQGMVQEEMTTGRAGRQYSNQYGLRKQGRVG